MFINSGTRKHNNKRYKRWVDINSVNIQNEDGSKVVNYWKTFKKNVPYKRYLKKQSHKEKINLKKYAQRSMP